MQELIVRDIDQNPDEEVNSRTGDVHNSMKSFLYFNLYQDIDACSYLEKKTNYNS